MFSQILKSCRSSTNNNYKGRQRLFKKTWFQKHRMCGHKTIDTHKIQKRFPSALVFLVRKIKENI